MAPNKAQIRYLHYRIAPIAIVPLFLSSITGSLYQVAILMGKAGDFYWLMQIHVGQFGPVNLSIVYPFLNALGALLLAVTGAMIWLQTPRRRKPQKSKTD
jgi:uncharacterized iron-regulated membrane protein